MRQGSSLCCLDHTGCGNPGDCARRVGLFPIRSAPGRGLYLTGVSRLQPGHRCWPPVTATAARWTGNVKSSGNHRILPLSGCVHHNQSPGLAFLGHRDQIPSQLPANFGHVRRWSARRLPLRHVLPYLLFGGLLRIFHGSPHRQKRVAEAGTAACTRY